MEKSFSNVDLKSEIMIFNLYFYLKNYLTLV